MNHYSTDRANVQRTTTGRSDGLSGMQDITIHKNNGRDMYSSPINGKRIGSRSCSEAMHMQARQGLGLPPLDVSENTLTYHTPSLKW